MVDPHDATLQSLNIDWATGTCVAHARFVAAPAGASGTITWRGLTAAQLTRRQPWGASDSILEIRSDRGNSIVELQSGDSVCLSSDSMSIELSEPLADRYAALIADALVDAGLLQRPDFARAAAVAALEITARRALGDL